MEKKSKYRIVAGAILILLALSECTYESRQKIPISPGEKFTEEVAIRVSRQAFQNAGFDMSKMEPVSYWHEQAQAPAENFFARNRSNPDEGYILWRDKDAEVTTHHSYSVRMMKSDNYVFCDIRKSK